MEMLLSNLLVFQTINWLNALPFLLTQGCEGMVEFDQEEV